MFAKMVLPRLGGTPAVWNTCMVFFQACLLAGYLYSHFAPRWLGLRRQVLVHLVVLALPILFLPLRLPAGWSPSAHHPMLSLLAVLTLSVGVPFFVVSTTGPLLQRWFTTTGHRAAADPYFLYAAGNTGSLLALLGYPVLVEPLLPVAGQGHWWSIGYGLLAVLIMACGMILWRTSPVIETIDTATQSPLLTARLRWILLALIPSSYLLGVTTFITTDIAAVPLFWVVPLAIYLLSFILVFLKRPLLPHASVVRLLPVAVVGVVLFQLAHAAQPVWLILFIHLLAFFLAAMACHGELARERPAAANLTDFYLMMSIGGVLGGLFTALLAPMIFSRAFEYPIAAVLACWVVMRKRRNGGEGDAVRAERFFGVSAGLCGILDVALPLGTGVIALVASRWQGQLAIVVTAGLPAMLCISFRARPMRFALTLAILLGIATIHIAGGGRAIEVHRSFFGVHRIVLAADGQTRELYHGATIHGRQHYDEGRPVDEPLTYYHRTGPIGDVFSQLPHDRTAVIGLGVGSVAAYVKHGESLTFFEIDPEVIHAADQSGSFHFLAAARRRGAEVNLVLGDARLTLTRSANSSFDLLVLDAFSGDAVPVHLLTREAIGLYLSKLTSRGVLAVHVSNIYLDLKPVLAALAREDGCAILCRDDLDVTPQEMRAGKSPSQWVVIARSGESLKPLKAPTWEAPTGDGQPAWTDDFSNVLTAMRWRR